MTAPFRDGQPGDAQAFYVGQLVDVKGRGRATVLETAEPGGAAGPATAGAAAAAPPAAAGQPPYLFAGRVHVRFHEDSTTYWVNPSHLRCMRPASAAAAGAACLLLLLLLLLRMAVLLLLPPPLPLPSPAQLPLNPPPHRHPSVVP